MAKPDFAATPILSSTLIGLWRGDIKRPTSRNRARRSRCFGVAKFLYRAVVSPKLDGGWAGFHLAVLGRRNADRNRARMR